MFKALYKYLAVKFAIAYLTTLIVELIDFEDIERLDKLRNAINVIADDN